MCVMCHSSIDLTMSSIQMVQYLYTDHATHKTVQCVETVQPVVYRWCNVEYTDGAMRNIHVHVHSCIIIDSVCVTGLSCFHSLPQTLESHPDSGSEHRECWGRSGEGQDPPQVHRPRLRAPERGLWQPLLLHLHHARPYHTTGERERVHACTFNVHTMYVYIL